MHLVRELLVKAKQLGLKLFDLVVARRLYAADIQEVRQYPVAGDRGYGFGVELHAVKLVFAVAQPHDGAALGARRDRKFFGQAFLVHDKGVIARDRECLRAVGQDVGRDGVGIDALDA